MRLRPLAPSSDRDFVEGRERLNAAWPPSPGDRISVLSCRLYLLCNAKRDHSVQMCRVFRSPSLVLPEQVASVSSLVFNASWPVMACAIAQLSSTHRFLCLMASKIANGNGPAFDMVRDTWAGVEPNLHGALNSISVFSRPKSIASRHSEVATSPAVPTPAMTVGHRRARVKSKRKKQQQWMKGLADRSSSVACAVYFQNLLEDEQCIDMNAEPCKS